MRIEINECEGTDYNASLLKLLAECTKGNIDPLLHRIEQGNIPYLDVFIKYQGKCICMVRGGETSEDVQEKVNKIKKLPAKYRRLPNDCMVIKADEFERELLIDFGV